MKKIVTLIVFIIISGHIYAQKKTSNIYDDKIDAMQSITEAIQQANKENKYVLCQVGGNWCPWCLRFAAFVENNSEIRKIVYDNFIYIHVNWSKENKNPEAMQFLGNPEHFGFPVFVIINTEGTPIHIQNSSVLEQDKGYSKEKVLTFLKTWTPQAINSSK